MTKQEVIEDIKESFRKYCIVILEMDIDHSNKIKLWEQLSIARQLAERVFNENMP